ncbi:large ribosomal subunit protein bL32m [Neocloeon triangulifer]|uniref:large ribosomal subunit protein bL32m n=1 Tax=Neocloeon triangulifer TaxID=2078957 RepID=UPI00286F27AF|nr:large ribosomal subunit protein bL32m [Neocloeon triangulifer]
MALRTTLISAKQLINSFEELCSVALGLRLPQKPHFHVVPVTNWDQVSTPVPQNSNPFGIGNGFLWAVPKHRRTAERRMKRKFGCEGNWKLILPRKDLTVCSRCGHHHEIGIMCSNCYKKVQEETKLAQNLVQEKLGLSAVDKEVILLYENESPPQDAQNKTVVEVPRPRPQWFSRNLLQRSTEVNSPKAIAEPETVSVSVKPSDLG